MRQFIRHPTDMPIEYQLQHQVHGGTQRLKNISKGGLCFVTQREIETGVGIHVSIPLEGQSYEADGVVVWCRSVYDGYLVGVQFEAPASVFTVRMVEQLCHIQQYRRRVHNQEGRKLTNEQAAAEWVEQYAAEFPQIA